MGARVTLVIADKNSSAVNTRTFEITTLEQTKADVEAIFAEHDVSFGRYYYEAHFEDEAITTEERYILSELIKADLMDEDILGELPEENS